MTQVRPELGLPSCCSQSQGVDLLGESQVKAVWVSLMRMRHLESFVTEQLFIPECPPLSTPMTSEHSLTSPSSTHFVIHNSSLKRQVRDQTAS